MGVLDEHFEGLSSGDSPLATMNREDPYIYPQLPQVAGGLAEKLERFQEGANYAEAVGRGGIAEKFRRRIARIMKGHPELQPAGPVQGFSDWKDLGPGSSHDAEGTLIRQHKQALLARARQGADIDMGHAMNRFKLRLSKDAEGAMKQGLLDEIDPSLQAAQERADSFAASPAISGAEEQAMRSRIASMVKSAEASRMARVGSMLGFGNMANSPAAAALAQESSMDADRTLVSTLRDMGLQVSEMNRNQARFDTDLATRIASARFNILNGDSKSLIGMQGDIASMIDALYSRDATMDMMKKQIEMSGEESSADRIGQWVGIAQGVVGLGAGLATGGVAGGSMLSGAGWGGK